MYWRIRLIKLKNNYRIWWSIIIKFKLTMYNWNLILLLPRKKHSLLKIMSRIWRKLRKNKIFWLILWMRKVRDLKNRRIYWRPKSYLKEKKLKRLRRYCMRPKYKWRKLLQVKKDYWKDGKNLLLWCKREIQLFKQPDKDFSMRDKSMHYY